MRNAGQKRCRRPAAGQRTPCLIPPELTRQACMATAVPCPCQNGRETAVISGRSRAPRTAADLGTCRLTRCVKRPSKQPVTLRQHYVAEFSRIGNKAAPLRPGARRASPRRHPPVNQLIASAPQDTMHRMPRDFLAASGTACPVGSRYQGRRAMGAGASSAPDCVALQGRPVKGSFAVASDDASATLDSPAPPGGFRQLSDEAPPRLS